MKYITIVLSFLLLNVSIYAQKNTLPKSLFLSEKNYYAKIFTKKERKDLQKGLNDRNKGYNLLAKYNEVHKKADDYRQKATMPGNKSKKYKKKAQKYDLKASKIAQKAYDKIFDGNKIINATYSQKLKSYKPDSANKFIINIIANEKKLTKDTLNSLQNKINKNKNPLALTKLYGKKSNLCNKFLLLSEYQFAVYQGDSAIIKAFVKPNKQTTPKDTVKPQNTDNVKPVTQYNPVTDANLYHPHYADLDSRIPYTNEELQKIQAYYQNGKTGFEKLNKAKFFADSLNKLNKQLATADFMTRSKILEQIKPVRDSKNYYNQLAIESYFSANENYYLARKNHEKDIKLPNNRQKVVDSIFDLASKHYKSAKFITNKPDTLIKTGRSQGKTQAFQIANKQMIIACEYQENALALQRGYAAYKVMPDNNLITFKPENDNKTPKDSTKTPKKKPKKTTNKTNKPKKCMFTGMYVYSYENPKPHQTVTPMGTIYRIQVGVSKYLLPVNELREYGQIYYETTNCSAYKYFLVGEYGSADEAQSDLMTLRNKGYNAKIVKFVDGKRVGAVYARKQTTTTSPQKSSKYNGIDVSQTRYLKYFIQIGTFSTSKTAKELKVNGQLFYRVLPDGRVQYFTGPYYRYDKAKASLPSIKNKGYSDALVVAFNNGNKITIQKALQIEKSATAANSVIYRVQLGAFSDYLSNEEYNKKFSSIADLYKIHTYKTSKGLIIYSAGDATTMEQARKIKRVVANMGFPDAFIIAFKGGEKVPLSSVNK